MMEKQSQDKKTDAGMRSVRHYRSRLPKWRYRLREKLIPIVRFETPYLAALQANCRSAALDTYFSLSASLGTHTFFMIMLPILFWCGYASTARALVNMLALGVFGSGVIKDLLCLPRPLSPPLQRISKSASVALEYGFPSTHSTNAVSVAVYAIHLIRDATEASEKPFLLPQVVLAIYALTIVFGRVYCGMHGIFDVVMGAVLGAAIGEVQYRFGAQFDDWIADGAKSHLFTFIVIIIVAVRMHPEPADDCPCFEDSVSFCGVLIGVPVGSWRFARSGYGWEDGTASQTPFSLEELGLAKSALRIAVGVVIVFAWRAFMKPLLLKQLPPLFRVVEFLGLDLPRKYFLKSSEYNTVPPLKKDDNLIPPTSEIPGIINSLSHPRKRTVSIGPQSEADAYETLAYRERRRRQSTESSKPRPGTLSFKDIPNDLNKLTAASTLPVDWKPAVSPAAFNMEPSEPFPELPSMIITEPNGHVRIDGATIMRPRHASEFSDKEIEEYDDALFTKLQVPRVRYDVEVVTKLIVYAGIGWLTLEFNPIIFEHLGLGLGVRPN